MTPTAILISANAAAAIGGCIFAACVILSIAAIFHVVYQHRLWKTQQAIAEALHDVKVLSNATPSKPTV